MAEAWLEKKIQEAAGHEDDSDGTPEPEVEVQDVVDGCAEVAAEVEMNPHLAAAV